MSKLKSSKSQALIVGTLTKLRKKKFQRRVLCQANPQRCDFLIHLWCLRPSVCVIQVAPKPTPEVRDCSNLASRGNTTSQFEDQDASDRVSAIQGTIGALERTLADASIPRGQGLESALQRQLAARRSDLSNSRGNSVIVTSTPDASQDLNLFNPGEGLSVPRSRRYSDPPPNRSRESSPTPAHPPHSPQVRQIPIVVTPAPSSIGVGQENSSSFFLVQFLPVEATL